MTATEFKNLQSGDRVRWDGGADARQPPSAATVQRHIRDDMSDTIELVWDDGEPSLLACGANLSAMQPFLQHLQKTK